MAGNYADPVNFSLVHGFLDTGGTFTTIDDPDGSPGTPTVNGINNLGTIVGTFTDGSGVQHSFIRSADGSTYLTIDDPSGFDTSIEGINDSGDIVGSYFTSLTSGQMSSFIATPTIAETVPEPMSFALSLAGLAAIACAKRLFRNQP